MLSAAVTLRTRQEGMEQGQSHVLWTGKVPRCCFASEVATAKQNRGEKIRTIGHVSKHWTDPVPTLPS